MSGWRGTGPHIDSIEFLESEIYAELKNLSRFLIPTSYIIRSEFFEWDAVKPILNEWLSLNYFYSPGKLPEWCYKNIRPNGFDFIRVDLYITTEGIKFGELTNYPDAGQTPFEPLDFDLWLGSKWKITDY